MSADMYGDIKNIYGDVKTMKISTAMHRINGTFGAFDDHFPYLDKCIDIPAHPLEERVVKFDSEVKRSKGIGTRSTHLPFIDGACVCHCANTIFGGQMLGDQTVSFGIMPEQGKTAGIAHENTKPCMNKCSNNLYQSKHADSRANRRSPECANAVPCGRPSAACVLRRARSTRRRTGRATEKDFPNCREC